MTQTSPTLASETTPDAVPKVAIVTEYASLRAGGEAARPIHYFRGLRARGIEAFLLTHDRNCKELQELLADELDRVYFAEDTRTQILLSRGWRYLPQRVASNTVYVAVRSLTQRQQRATIHQLVAEQKVNLVHEPVPISPKQPSGIYGVGVPVIIGPLNGDIDYPPAFRSRESLLTRSVLKVGRSLSGVANTLQPGKKRANLLLVSNERTAKALPPGCRGRVERLVANAVDLEQWANVEATGSTDGVCRFVFLGRLVDFKGVDLLIEAFAKLRKGADQAPIALSIIGDGPKRSQLEQHAKAVGGDITFHGWQPHDKATQLMKGTDVFILPTLQEAGGAVVMEAMCLGLPVIASDWGGPADYLIPGAGILVKPETREQFVTDLARAMGELANDPARRRAMGQLGRAHALSHFGWQHRVDALIEHYKTVLREVSSPA